MACLGAIDMLDRSREPCVAEIAHENPKRAAFTPKGASQAKRQP